MLKRVINSSTHKTLEFYNKVLCVLELMMIKKNIVPVSFVFLDMNDINVCISAVCSNRS